MTPPFADALTWVPKSRALAASLAQAHDFARARGHASVTLEHLLQALLEDPDAAPVLQACRVDLDDVAGDLSRHLASLPESDQPMPGADPGLLKILEYAVAAAQQSRRREVTGAIVLAAIVGEGKSDAANLLQQRGLTFEATVKALQSGAGAPQPARTAAAPPAQQRPAPQLQPPAPVAREPADSALEDPITAARRRVQAAKSAMPHAAAAAAQPANGYEPNPTRPPRLPADTPAASLSRPAVQDDDRQAFDETDNTFDGLPAASGLRPAAPPDTGQGAYGDSASTAFETRYRDPGSLNGHDADGQEALGWAPPPSAPQPAANPRAPRNAFPLQVPEHPFVAQPGPHPAGFNGQGTAPPWAGPPAGAMYQPPFQAEPEIRPAVPRASLLQTHSFSPESLLAALPKRLKAGRSVNVSVRVPRGALPALDAGASRNVNDATDDGATRLAVSVRLKSTQRGLFIEPLGPETQWLDNRVDPMVDEEARWRWTVTPQRSGRTQFEVGLSFRSIGRDAMTVETVVPVQISDIRVRRNQTQTVALAAALVGTAIVGAMVARVAGDALWREAVAALAKLFG